MPLVINSLGCGHTQTCTHTDVCIESILRNQACAGRSTPGLKSLETMLNMELNGCYRMKVDSKAFTNFILTTSAFTMFDVIAVRIGIANALELTFIL